MEVEITVTMEYLLASHDPVLFQVEAAATDGQVILQSAISVDAAALQILPGEFGLGQRVWAIITGDQLAVQYRAKVQVTRADLDLAGLAAMPVASLPPEALSCLRPSRFCQSDLFTNFVGQTFGQLEGGAKVAAILQWVQAETSYISGSSGGSTTAVDTFQSRQGVCRDFAHLVCALVRAGNIPARYVSVYGADVQPPDFHAAAQVWLSGAWHLVDATGMCRPSGMVLIGAGRDAADVAFMETSQWPQLVSQTVTVTR